MHPSQWTNDGEDNEETQIEEEDDGSDSDETITVDVGSAIVVSTQPNSSSSTSTPHRRARVQGTFPGFDKSAMDDAMELMGNYSQMPRTSRAYEPFPGPRAVSQRSFGTVECVAPGSAPAGSAIVGMAADASAAGVRYTQELINEIDDLHAPWPRDADDTDHQPPLTLRDPDDPAVNSRLHHITYLDAIQGNALALVREAYQRVHTNPVTLDSVTEARLDTLARLLSAGALSVIIYIDEHPVLIPVDDDDVDFTRR
ncbi:hypothetical protein DXG01_004579 [Tephrocybe rancida]|nr:hypothetical protein DXG01_004579 [Tephrocybe rancida]